MKGSKYDATQNIPRGRRLPLTAANRHEPSTTRNPAREVVRCYIRPQLPLADINPNRNASSCRWLTPTRPDDYSGQSWPGKEAGYLRRKVVTRISPSGLLPRVVLSNPESHDPSMYYNLALPGMNPVSCQSRPGRISGSLATATA